MQVYNDGACGTKSNNGLITGLQAINLYKHDGNPSVPYLPLCWPSFLGSHSLTLGALLVAADKHDKRSTVKSNTEIGAIAGTSESTVKRSLKVLMEKCIPDDLDIAWSAIGEIEDPMAGGRAGRRWLLNIEKAGSGRKTLKRLGETRSEICRQAKRDNQLLPLPVYARCLPFNEALVYSYVVLRAGVSHRSESSLCFGSYRDIAKKLGLDERNCQTWLYNLEGRRLVKVSEGKVELLFPPDYFLARSERIARRRNDPGRRRNDLGSDVEMTPVRRRNDPLTTTITRTGNKNPSTKTKHACGVDSIDRLEGGGEEARTIEDHPVVKEFCRVFDAGTDDGTDQPDKIGLPPVPPLDQSIDPEVWLPEDFGESA